MGTYRIFRNNQKGATITIEKKVQIILQKVDKEYTVPSYMENNVKRGIKEALLIIKREETSSLTK